MTTASKNQDCPPIDRDHKVLFTLIAELEGRVSKPLAGQNLDQLLVKLRAYFDAHFENEEAFMRRTEYPGAEGHCATHKEFLELFEASAGQSHADQDSQTTEMLSILKRWLIIHIDGTDRARAEHLTRLGIVVTPTVFPGAELL